MPEAATRADSPPGVRTIVTVVAVVLAALTVGMAAALVFVTSSLKEESAVVRSTVQIARLARELDVDLLLFEQDTDPAVRDRVQSTMRGELDDAEGIEASSARTQALRDRVRLDVDRYLSASQKSPGAFELERARATIDRLVVANLQDAENARLAAARLHALAKTIAAATALPIAALLGFIVLWLRDSVVRPMLVLSRTMDRFGKGDLSARAPPTGARELQTMTEQFNGMADAIARQREARRDQLAAVAHDLRNPLAALEMSAALVDQAPGALAALAAQIEPAARRPSTIIRRQVGRLARMVEDLVDTTRIEAGKLPLTFRDADLRPIVQSTAEMFDGISPKHVLRVELPEQELRLHCDARRIEHTISNVISNAIKYSPRGGEIVVTASRSGDYAEVSVSDQGEGIRAADLEKIWEPYERRGVSAELVPGVGLGLWAARRIVEAHAGSIRVRSAVGEGSTFTIALPLADRPRAGALAPSVSVMVPAHG